jgi:hypothetical protein
MVKQGCQNAENPVHTHLLASLQYQAGSPDVVLLEKQVGYLNGMDLKS